MNKKQKIYTAFIIFIVMGWMVFHLSLQTPAEANSADLQKLRTEVAYVRGQTTAIAGQNALILDELKKHRHYSGQTFERIENKLNCALEDSDE